MWGEYFSEVFWTPGTIVRLCKVPWDSNYRDIVWFDSREKLGAYLIDNSETITFNNATPVTPDHPLRLDVPYSRAREYNYLQVFNPADTAHFYEQQDYGLNYFYFINDIHYAAPNATLFDIQLDVWSTFHNNIYFTNAFVERGHVGIANNSDDPSRWRRYLTVPESLDLGSDLWVGHTFYKKIADINNCTYLIQSSVALEGDNGDVNNPNLTMAKGCRPEGSPSALNIYLCDKENLYVMLQELQSKPWVSSGIQSITAVPGDWLQGLDTENVTVGSFSNLRRLKRSYSGAREIINIGSKYRQYLGTTDERYSHLTKLKTYPYSAIEITTYTGNPLVLRPELMPADNDDIDVLGYYHYALPAPRVAFCARNYNRNPSANSIETDNGYWIMDGGEDFDTATWWSNFPQYPVLNDGYLNTIASQAHSIQYAHHSAEWVRDKSLTAAQNAYDISTATTANMMSNTGIQTSLANQMNTINNNQAWDQNLVSNLQGLVGVGGAIASGSVGGAISGISGIAGGIANTAISTGANSARTAASNAATIGIANNNAGLQNQVRDINKAYADYAAQGDYANAIEGINAKLQDTKITQPTISGQSGGDAFIVNAIGYSLTAKIKVTDPQATMRIGDFWLRYGYAINRYMSIPENLQVMEKFTYWKMTESRIEGHAPEYYKNVIRGIFEKGVTVHAHPSTVRRLPIYNNAPVKGDYY